MLKLPAPNEAAILRFDYDAAWAPEANGQGRSLEVVDTTLSYKLWDQRSTWAASEQPDGTPGYDANSPAAESIVINEVLSHTDLPQVDSIELHNRSGAAVDVGGWYLSDSGGTPQKFQIPQGTVIQGGGYFVFDENDFNSSLGADPNDFALSSSEGETLWLWEAVNGQLTQSDRFDTVRCGCQRRNVRSRTERNRGVLPSSRQFTRAGQRRSSSRSDHSQRSELPSRRSDARGRL